MTRVVSCWPVDALNVNVADLNEVCLSVCLCFSQRLITEEEQLQLSTGVTCLPLEYVPAPKTQDLRVWGTPHYPTAQRSDKCPLVCGSFLRQRVASTPRWSDDTRSSFFHLQSSHFISSPYVMFLFLLLLALLILYHDSR